MPLSNARISELLARRARTAEDPGRARAYRRASEAALVWGEEAADVVAAGRSLTAYRGIGPRLSALIESWLDEPPEPEDVPEERAEFMTMAEAKRVLDENPGWRGSVRGDLQMHTTYSDGSEPLWGMAEACSALAYEYAAVTDHSKGLRIARGLDEERLADQGRAIDSTNRVLDRQGSTLTLLRSVEMNLDGEGKGDLEPDALGELDLVLGSFHSALRTKEDCTGRYLGALDNPWVDVLGHPRGRRFDRRGGLRADWDVVFETAAERRAALEVNASVLRQDLQLSLLELASRYDVLVSIGTDSHSVGELRFVDYGLATLVMAGIPPERVINTWTLDRLRAWVAERRSRP